MKSTVSRTVIDDYIDGFPSAVQARLRAVRKTIRQNAPAAVEKISYRIPTFYLVTNLVHFAAFARHVGFYPGPSGIARFQADLAPYKSSKGAVQFPHDEPLPLRLIAAIVRFRVAENVQGAGKHRKKA